MEISTFLRHHGLLRNPFEAEEARHDPVFTEMIDGDTTHPDLEKILGDVSEPSSAVVFGEKGSGKTAIRLVAGRRIAAHNRMHPERSVLAVGYDDLNPFLDRIAERHRRRLGTNRPETLLGHVRLEDHQDAILSLATTKLVNALLGTTDPGAETVELPDDAAARLKQMPHRVRLDLATLAALYDEPRSGTALPRWRALAKRLGVTAFPSLTTLRYGAAILLAIAAVSGLVHAVGAWWSAPPVWASPIGWGSLALSAAGWLWWGWRHLEVGLLARKLKREMPAVGRTPGELRRMLATLSRGEVQTRPMPVPGVDTREARYELTQHLIGALEPLGYRAILVLVDRVDEPTLVMGKTERMQPVVWPLFDNKFLQQNRVGIKLLLPLELRHRLYREPPEFFQQARLDKQHFVDRLSWSGAVLYDLCSGRMRRCAGENGPKSLKDLFEADVSREMIVDALDQMHQPRDAFKFLYHVIQEHCRTVPNDQEAFLIPRLTLESTRRQEAQRVQELAQGHAPA